jgi:hypothetical protein
MINMFEGAMDFDGNLILKITPEMAIRNMLSYVSESDAIEIVEEYFKIDLSITEPAKEAQEG